MKGSFKERLLDWWWSCQNPEQPNEEVWFWPILRKGGAGLPCTAAAARLGDSNIQP